ncbi:TetR/AcrR family transcriptional regulator [Streptomyces sp. NPDC050504]|uniref:TetR/AcrR family transcriptional regulator n=1 Tax=Streptomyces sp. NPDC050504 TaxID=3365618 RepID=UPI0037BB10ED
MASTKAPDSSRRSERSRRAILEAALALVGEVGYDKLTVESIASRAGVGKQTIYRWWPSKAAVLLDAAGVFAESPPAEDGGAEDGGAVAAVFPDTGDLAADLKLVLRATVDEFHDARVEAPMRALTAAGATDPELGRTFTERYLAPALGLYEERLRVARERGEIGEDVDLRVAVEMLVGPLHHRWLHRTGPVTHEFAEALVNQVLGGIVRGT